MPALTLSALIALALLLTGPALAQPEGSVRYKTVLQLNLQDVPPEMEVMVAAVMDRLPQEVSFHNTVRFQGGTAVTETRAAESALRVDAGGLSFVDVEAGLQIRQERLMDRLFLVEDSLEPIAWRLTGETGSFLGYEVHQAAAEHNGRLIEAWFTPEIPAPVGPEGYHGLPGLILLLTENGGERTITAQEVSLAPLTAALAPPTEGRRVSAEELGRIREERLNALGAGGRSVTIIRPGSN